MQDLAQKLHAVRAFVRLKPYINHHVPSFIKERMIRGLRGPDSLWQRLEKAVKDKPRTALGLHRRGIPVVEQRVEARPKLLEDKIDRHLRKRICLEHLQELRIALFSCENHRAPLQSKEQAVHGHHDLSTRGDRQLRVKNGGIGLFL